MSNKTPFVHLHNHSSYSVRDGLQRVDTICAAAAADGQPAVAITDHGSLGGAWKLQGAAEAAGVKAIMGTELYLAFGSRFEHNYGRGASDEELGAGGGDAVDEAGSGGKARRYQHLTVLAATPEGWRSLLAVANAAQDSFWSKPRADMELLAANAKGLIVLSGCLGGPVAGPLVVGDSAGAEANLARLVEIYGPESVFVEVMDHGIAAETRIVPELVRLAKHFGVGVVATNDAHYTRPDEHVAHDAWLCLGQDDMTLSDPNRWQFPGEGYHMRTTAEMRALFDDQPGTEGAVNTAYAISERIADRVLPTPGLRIPKVPLPDGTNAAKVLAEMAKEGAKARYGDPYPPEVAARLTYEMRTIKAAGLADYFLIVADMISWARSEGIRVGPGRGSCVGAAIAYVTGITQVDPLAHGLLFERFLNPERAGMPDIDTDFEKRRREEVIAYLEKRWGRDRVARIGTVGISLTQASLRHVGRIAERGALGAKLAEAVPIGPGGKPYSFAELADPAAGEEAKPFRDALAAGGADAEELLALARSFEGVVANEGIHACGVVVADRPLVEMIPLRRDRRDGGSGGVVSEWDGKDIDSLGLLKLDVLGLRNLDAISATVDIIEGTTGERVDPESFETSGSPRAGATWEMIGQGRTAGVFQLDSGGMTRLCEAIKPADIDEMAAVIALFRPGPLGEGMHERYAERKAGREKVDYGIFTSDPAEVDAIASVLGETYGVPVFQEQIMRLGEVVAGFGPPERNRLQKAVSKKNRDEMEAVGALWMEGAASSEGPGGVPKVAFGAGTAAKLWDAIKGAASYSFNKSHAVGYGYVAYQTAYLKANWPAAYGAGLLSCTTDDAKRLAVLRYLADEGISVKGPDVNLSAMSTSVDPTGAVRLGLGEVKGVGSQASAIVAERQAHGDYSSVADVIGRVKDHKGANLSIDKIENLIEAGAFDTFDPHRLGLMTIARAIPTCADLAVPEIEWGAEERSARERVRLGVAVSGSPLGALNQELQRWRLGDPEWGRKPIPLRNALDVRGNVATAGVISHFKIAKKGRRRANLTLEGSKDSVDGVIWGDALAAMEAAGQVPYLGQVVGAVGRMKLRSGRRRVRDESYGDEEYLDEPVVEDEERVEITVAELYDGDFDGIGAVSNLAPQPVPRLWVPTQAYLAGIAAPTTPRGHSARRPAKGRPEAPGASVTDGAQTVVRVPFGKSFLDAVASVRATELRRELGRDRFNEIDAMLEEEKIPMGGSIEMGRLLVMVVDPSGWEPSP